VGGLAFEGVEERSRGECADDAGVGVVLVGESDAEFVEGVEDEVAVFARCDDGGGGEGVEFVGAVEWGAGVGEAGEAVPEGSGEGRALLGADGASEFGEASGEAGGGVFVPGDVAVAGAECSELGASVGLGGVALHDPAVVSDESVEDSVHVAAGVDFVVEDAEVGIEGDAAVGEEELCGEVVFLGVVVEARVVSASVEEGVSSYGGAASDEDLGESAAFACASGGEVDVGGDGEDVWWGGLECAEEACVGGVGVVVEHDDPFAGVVGCGDGVVSGGGAVVLFESEEGEFEGVCEGAWGAGGGIGGVVDDDDLCVCGGEIESGERVERLGEASGAVAGWEDECDFHARIARE